MKARNHYFAFVSRFVDAVTTEALSTELLAQRRARLQFEASQREAIAAVPARKAA